MSDWPRYSVVICRIGTTRKRPRRLPRRNRQPLIGQRWDHQPVSEPGGLSYLVKAPFRPRRLNHVCFSVRSDPKRGEEAERRQPDRWAGEQGVLEGAGAEPPHVPASEVPVQAGAEELGDRSATVCHAPGHRAPTLLVAVLGDGCEQVPEVARVRQVAVGAFEQRPAGVVTRTSSIEEVDLLPRLLANVASRPRRSPQVPIWKRSTSL